MKGCQAPSPSSYESGVLSFRLVCRRRRGFSGEKNTPRWPRLVSDGRALRGLFLLYYKLEGSSVPVG